MVIGACILVAASLLRCPALIPPRRPPAAPPIPIASALSARMPFPPHEGTPGVDAFQHLTVSFGATNFAYAAARLLDAARGPASVAAATTTVAAGIAKELRDHARGGGFGASDLAFDLVGVALGLVVVRHTR